MINFAFIFLNIRENEGEILEFVLLLKSIKESDIYLKISVGPNIKHRCVAEFSPTHEKKKKHAPHLVFIIYHLDHDQRICSRPPELIISGNK